MNDVLGRGARVVSIDDAVVVAIAGAVVLLLEWRLERDGEGYRKAAGVREDNWVWSPQGRIYMHLPERWGRFVFAPDAGRE